MLIAILLAEAVGLCLTVLSRASPSLDVVSPSGTGLTEPPLRKRRDDRLLHVPLCYTLSLGPSAGVDQTLIDPQYGCALIRPKTLGELQAGQVNHHNYSTVTPFSAVSSRVMLLFDNGSEVTLEIQENLVVPAIWRRIRHP